MNAGRVATLALLLLGGAVVVMGLSLAFRGGREGSYLDTDVRVRGRQPIRDTAQTATLRGLYDDEPED